MRFRSWLAVLIAPVVLTVDGADTKRVSFNRDVRPLLSEYCLNCHGFDDKTRKGGLRLDQREDALRGGKSGHAALLPGKSAESEIIRRLLTTDPDEVMPPPKMDRTLTAAQMQWRMHMEMLVRQLVQMQTQPHMLRIMHVDLSDIV